jgi:simple sugar transport system permease protein
MLSINVSVTPRGDVPSWFDWGIPISAVLASLIAGAIIITFAGGDVIQFYSLMLFEPLYRSSSQTLLALRTVPLLLTALAVYVPLRAGLYNIGGEGQFYIGAITATIVALNLSVPWVLTIPVILGVSALGGVVWGIIPGCLRALFDVNEIITSLLLVFIATGFTEYLLTGPLQSRDGYPASDVIPDVAQLPTIFDTRIHIGVIFVPVIIAFIYTLMNQTILGFQIRSVGANPVSSRIQGMRPKYVYVTVFAIAGGIAGLAGAIELLTSARLQSNISPGYGFTAIPIALLGRESAFHVFIAALFFGLLFAGSTAVSVKTSISPSIVSVIEALIILFYIIGEGLRNYRISISQLRGQA